jgi:hypothetical protein
MTVQLDLGERSDGFEQAAAAIIQASKLHDLAS